MTGCSSCDMTMNPLTRGGGRKKKYKIQADNIQDAFHKLEKKVKGGKGGKGDILVLQLESLDDKNKINFYKIYRKKM